MQIRPIGKPSIDTVLSHIVERYETQFPGRIRACYLTGSYAEGNAVEWSDIDVYVLFKDAFVSEEEAAQAEQLERALELIPIGSTLSGLEATRSQHERLDDEHCSKSCSSSQGLSPPITVVGISACATPAGVSSPPVAKK